MKITTLCYMERGGRWLMLHRTRTATSGSASAASWKKGRARKTACAARCAKRPATS